MRGSKWIGAQSMKPPEVKRLGELENESGLLKLPYADLLQKFLAMKDSLTRSARAC
ncbi:MAG: hypothetical protein P0120_03205 [Nitrospira sp.]|nr:hypothetical protein [Nitrospira sp.]